MKKRSYSYTFNFTVYLFILLSCLSEILAEPVNIPDPGLRRALEQDLGKSPGDIITQAEMGADSFKILSASEKNISDLTGLEYATNLRFVYLESNSISDISPLSDLTSLEHLHLEHNQITDLSALSNITTLQSLNISYNNLTGLDGLPDLSATYALFFQHNQITSLQTLVDHTEYTGIGKTHTKVVNFQGNPLDNNSVNVHIPHLLFDRYIDVQFTATFIKKVSGDKQTAATNTKLKPFTVEVTNHKKEKLSGTDVRFILVSGRGNFVNGTNNGENPSLDLSTDVDGKATAILTTGSSPGTYRIAVQVREVRSNSIFVTGAEPFTVTVVKINSSSPLLNQTSQEQQVGTSTQEQQVEQPQQEQEEQQEIQQQEPSQQVQPSKHDTPDLPQQQQEIPSSQQQQETTSEQNEEQEEQEETQQQESSQRVPPSKHNTPDLPQQPQQETQQQESLIEQPESETELIPEHVQQPELNPEPETNYTIIPFDYKKDGVGKVVFSELMLTHLGKYPQWIELYNTTDQDIDIDKWKIVGRFLDDTETVHLLESQVISKSFTIKSKETGLIVNYSIPNSRDRISIGLVDKTYDLQSETQNLFNYQGLVLELQDAEGKPIDRIGNLNVENDIVWEIPIRVRNRRISLIRRLKTMRSQVYNFTLGVKKFGWFPADRVNGITADEHQYYYGRYTDIGTPGYRTENGDVLPVTLSSFIPQLNKDGTIRLSWVTESEIDNAGFNILRGQSKQGPFVKVNAKLIQGAGTTSERSVYTWTDTTAKPNIAYFYQIEDVSFAGIRQTLATARLKGMISANNRLTTLWGQMKTGN
ncbi:MAG: leucine-rich repeat domain-containing protein [Candidatus Poribacteria bacterium]|nr:leucine-rich repeat domain-containing protein [Candidatus Poribacteria bacterium]